MITIAALAAWALNAAVGTFLLVRWWRGSRRSVPPQVFVHLGVMVTGLALWTVRTAGQSAPVLAWSAFAVLTLGNVLGDLVLTRGWRGRQRDRTVPALRSYGAAVLDVLRGRRPVASVHAALAGLTYALVLASAIAER